MKIQVRLFATLREGRASCQEIELAPGSSLADVLTCLEIERPEVSIRLVNGREAEWDSPLKEGDSVSLFPGVGGG